MIKMKYSEDWSPTGFVARFRLTGSESGLHEAESAIITWGANGEPLVDVYLEEDGKVTQGKTLTDASTLPHFIGIDGALYRGAPISAQPGWSVEITHPSGAKETRPVLGWLQTTGDGEAAPMVPGTGELEGYVVYVGQEYDEPAYKFDKKLIPAASIR